MKLNCIVVDDERLARKGMENYIAKVPGLELIGSCSDTYKAMEVLQEYCIDLMFLDIQMPGMTGLTFLKSLKNSPATIITTAYSKYAPEGYELDVIDYLIKPVPFERFVRAVNKAAEFIHLKQGETSVAQANDYFFVKCNQKYEKIFVRDIYYVEAMQNYVIFKTAKGNFVSYLTLRSIEEFLPDNGFTRVHKSYVVSNDKVESIDGNFLSIHGHAIPVSRGFYEQAMKNIMGNKILKRS